MTTNQQTVSTATPFRALIDHRGFAVKDCNERIWAVCRNDEQARLIVEALNTFAKMEMPERRPATEFYRY
jgi:hypothetical protein